jgi:hypothetical protein
MALPLISFGKVSVYNFNIGRTILIYLLSIKVYKPYLFSDNLKKKKKKKIDGLRKICSKFEIV